MLVIHIIWNANLSEDKGMISHIIQALLAKKLELVTQAVPDCRLANLDCERRCPVLASKYTNDIHVVKPVPVRR